MQNIGKSLIPSFLAVILVACNNVASTPTLDPMYVAKVAIPIAETGIAMTQTAAPTATQTATPTATYTPTSTATLQTVLQPETEKILKASFEDKIDYARETASKIYNLFPYISKVTPYGEYSGCFKTHDFHFFLSYTISLPMESVKTAFLTYFSNESWEFTEETSQLMGLDNNISRTIYDVYRISSKDVPALERLKVFLTDETSVQETDYINVRAELTHIETKKNFRYLASFYCPNDQSWLGVGLQE